MPPQGFHQNQMHLMICTLLIIYACLSWIFLFFYARKIKYLQSVAQSYPINYQFTSNQTDPLPSWAPKLPSRDHVSKNEKGSHNTPIITHPPAQNDWSTYKKNVTSSRCMNLFPHVISRYRGFPAIVLKWLVSTMSAKDMPIGCGFSTIIQWGVYWRELNAC